MYEKGKENKSNKKTSKQANKQQKMWATGDAVAVFSPVRASLTVGRFRCFLLDYPEAPLLGREHSGVLQPPLRIYSYSLLTAGAPQVDKNFLWSFLPSLRVEALDPFVSIENVKSGSAVVRPIV